MPLPFSALSALLTRLEETPAEKSNQVISKWFSTHRQEIDSLSVSSAVALLSSLLPERRSDRVYAIQSATLCRILGRGLSLCTAQLKDLQAYRLPGRGDIGACLERVLRAGGPPALPVVTVDEVDQVLNKLAAQCRFSGDKRLSLEEKDRMIGNVFKRLSPGCAKWLTRLILKDLSSAVIDDNFVLIEFHFLLPDILRFQNDFSVAVSLLKSAKLRAYPSHADAQSRALHHQTAAMMLEPRVGCKVGLPTFVKARGMDSCLKIVGERSWVLERKYDGEYCEVHVDLSASASLEGCITIFSKSGKESTQDRRGLLPSLIASLRLGQEWCKIRDRAIMLGEIFVWSTLGGVLGEGGIMPFDKIRKHVSRSGTIVGTEMDSPVHEHEQLAIVFFDLLLLDDEVVMARSVEERRAMLRKVYAKIHGRVMGAEWKIVDFAAPTARSTLERHFAASIAQRCEGLVLKPCGEPYFPLVGETARPFIKVKKDYIDGLGDEADFAVIGGSYNPQLVRKEYGKVHWTDFHLGCLLNPDEVRRFQKRPSYRLVGTLSAGPCVPKAIVKSLNALGQGAVDNQPPYVFDIEGSKTLGTRFKKPFVLEVLGSGFVNPPNSGGSYMLRHPRARRLHHDRHWTTCVSFQELQTQAQVALDRKDDDADEAKAWLRRLKGNKKQHPAIVYFTNYMLKNVSLRRCNGVFSTVYRHNTVYS
ncbi:DNA ligase/mRNA capping enzyme [Piedraia hortae CBS 480.64]|uniref:DNA ligase/mRNA capping enzyme n=1 Tax=Piedraia hortae CBS 480.64 TaxID=1314780 RepID=A0A6A7BZB1_9PEZI|nr:DNA ligase/mRNA capping enzyme [Piedraia hortae CBS 480.64]